MSLVTLKTAVVIPHYHRGEKSLWLLMQLLRSLRTWHPELLTHTLLVDDGSTHEDTDRHLALLVREFGVRALRRVSNGGYSKTVNVGLRKSIECGFNFAITINNDVELKTPLHALARHFSEHPRTWVQGACLLFPTGNVQHAGFNVESDGSINPLGAGQAFWGHPTATRSRYCSGVTGALQAIRLRGFQEHGLYSEAYRMGYEDVEFCMRSWKHGGHVYYNAEVLGVHHESATRGYQIREREWESLQQWGEDVQRFDKDAVLAKVAELNSPQPSAATSLRPLSSSPDTYGSPDHSKG